MDQASLHAVFINSKFYIRTYWPWELLLISIRPLILPDTFYSLLQLFHKSGFALGKVINYYATLYYYNSLMPLKNEKCIVKQW